MIARIYRTVALRYIIFYMSEDRPINKVKNHKFFI